MKAYQYFASVLTQLLGAETAVRLTVNGYMPLLIETIEHSGDGNRLVSICHYGEQNGDLMRDPDMVFEFHTYTTPYMAEPILFRNDYLGMLQEVYRYNDAGKKNHVDMRLQTDLKRFASTWFKNIKDQGFLGESVRREILS